MTTTTQPRVAYFCMEFALHEDLPIYAGGLGVLAGDHMKSAHDLGVPLVGLGLLWSEGYTHQKIEHGEVVDHFEPLARPLRDTGKRVTVRVYRKDIEVRIVEVEGYGNAPLYLLEPVAEEDRWITRRLYGGGPYDRVAQEIVLGIGGVRALRAMGLEVDVYHFNEGHAVLAGLELVRERMEELAHGQPGHPRAVGDVFHDAIRDVRPKIVFTTHTPVEAGNEQHHYEVLRDVGAYNGLTHEQMVELGGPHSFNMTVAGMKLARAANAVSALHGEVAREMWKWVEGAAKIGHITNGVHVPTWQDARIRDASTLDGLAAAHAECKREMIAELLLRTGARLDENALTIGFARRATGYKRPDLIFRDPARIEALLSTGRVQLIFSGKAHPNDGHGKHLVMNLYRLSQQYPGRVVFVQDYDMKIGRLLTRGCDVWLNNPRRPLEASGTSGMKAALNGVLNLSIPDGWWDEAAVHGENGWNVGGATAADDDRDAQNLYAVLENEVLPRWENDRARWHEMMRAAVAMGRERFSTERMLGEYYAKLYAKQAVVEVPMVAANR